MMKEALTNEGYPVHKPEFLDQSFGDRLSKSLRYAGISHDEMAQYLEVHRNSVGNWCQGKARMMPVILRAWAIKVGLPVEWLRDGIWPENKPKPAARKTTKQQVKPVSRRSSRRPS